MKITNQIHTHKCLVLMLCKRLGFTDEATNSPVSSDFSDCMCLGETKCGLLVMLVFLKQMFLALHYNKQQVNSVVN